MMNEANVCRCGSAARESCPWHLRHRGTGSFQSVEMRTINRHVKIVDSMLAFHMGRLAAARQNATGSDVLTLPVLAGRVAGGFRHIVDCNQLSTAMSAALAAGGFADIEEVRELPGTLRAVIETLHRVWM